MSPRDGLERVRQALDTHGVALTSHPDGSWRGRCPVHQGQTRTSLSVRHHVPAGSDRGRAQLRCWGRCDERDVLELIGLTLADLYDDPPPRTTDPVHREHIYTNRNGHLVGVVRRTEPKSFRPASPTGTGWKAASSDELKSLPYNLQAVLDAVKAGQVVYVPEGEHDCDALAAVGAVGTCNAGGAGKWTAAHAEYLRGADVVVVRDRDEPGARHAAQVAESLAGIARSVRIVEPATGKDVAEHLAAGRTLDDLVPVGGASSPAPGARRLKVTKASAVKVRRQRWLWDNRVVLGGLTLLAGREGLGKSTVACDVCAQTTRGVLDGEFKGDPRTVIYLHSEDARDTTIVPRLVAAGADLDRVIFVDAVQSDEDGEFESQVVLPTDVSALADLAIEHDAALVVLDAATSVIDSRLDGDKDRQMRKGLEAIARGIGERADCAVLGIVHFGKRDSGDTGKLILGSIAWSQVARSVLAVAKDDESGDLVISATKSNLAPGDAASLSARLVNHTVTTEDGDTNVGRVEWLGETEQNARDLLSGPEADDGRSETDEAVKWLEDYLADKDRGGTAPAGDVIRAAKRDGIAERTLQRARKKAGVASVKGAGSWNWTLQGANNSKAVTSKDAKAPTHEHVQAPWRLGALAPWDADGNLEEGTTGAAPGDPLPSPPAEPAPPRKPWPKCECGTDIYRAGATTCARCDLRAASA